MLALVDTYAGGWNVLLIALLECICISYVYGKFTSFPANHSLYRVMHAEHYALFILYSETRVICTPTILNLT